MTVEVLYFDGCPNHEALVPHLEALLRTVGLEVLTTISLRSVAYRLEHELSTLDPVLQAEAEEVLESVSTWPEVVASSGHALVIARRG